jgi:hypothetical protein
MTWAGYPQIVLVARSPRSIFPGNQSCRAKIFASKTIRIQRAARDMNSIMADPYPIRLITVDEHAGLDPAPMVPAALLGDTGTHAGHQDHAVHRHAGAGRVAAS